MTDDTEPQYVATYQTESEAATGADAHQILVEADCPADVQGVVEAQVSEPVVLIDVTEVNPTDVND